MLKPHKLVYIILFTSFVFPVSISAQVHAKLSNAEYSQVMLDRLNAMTATPAMRKTGVPDRLRNNKTLLLFEATKNFSRLTPEAQVQFNKTLARPTGLSSTYSETTKNFFKFYYTTTGTNAVATTDANSNGVPDYVENMAVAFVRALTVYDSLGYTRPPIATSDAGRYPVYLSNTAAGSGVYGFAQPETQVGDNPNSTATENSAYTSYMCMRNNYTGFGSTDALLQIAMEVTTAHEFFHAIQFGYETNNMTSFPMEMCSTWGEDIVFPTDDDNWQYLSEIFSTPYLPVDYDDDLDGTTIASGHWYASWIFERYITDRFGADVTKTFFENTVSSYWSTALNNALVAKGSTLTNTIKDYNVAIGILTSSNTAPMSTYRFQRGDNYRLATGTQNSYGPFVVAYQGTITYNGTKVTYASTSNSSDLLYRASADFIKIVPSANFSISAAPTTTNTYFSCRLLKMNSYTNPTVMSVVEPTVSGSNYTFNITDKTSYSNYVLVVYNTRYATSSARTITAIPYSVVVDAATSSNSVSLTSPVGGESWVLGAAQNITWTSSNVTNVMLEYSSDNGSNWSTIIASTAASAGTYVWTVPSTATTTAKIRISDASNSAINAVSGVFTIAAQSSSTTVINEPFTKATTGSVGSPDGTDVSASLDTYTTVTGWTGSKVYQAGGTVKLGSSSAIGYIVTPSLNLTSATGSLKFDLQTYGSDTKTVLSYISTNGGTTYTQIGSAITPTSSMVTQTIPYTGATSTTKFKISAGAASSNRFYLDNIIVTNDNATVTAPTTQALNITFSSIQSAQMTASWTNGNGAGRVVKINTANSFTVPTDGTAPTAATAYSGSGEQCVYNGTSTSVTVTGLSSGSTYYFRVYEYNGSSSTTKYLSATGTNNPNSQATTTSYSSASDIITNASFTPSSNIAYATYQDTTLTTSNSVDVGEFTIRDGAGSTDADAQATTLNSITFSVANYANLRKVAIFDGTNNIATLNAASTLTFNGLSLAAADGGTKTFLLRATFAAFVTDNQQFSFTVTAASASGSGSTFAAAAAGGAASPTTGDYNRIEVAATTLAFVQQPSSASINTAISPAVTVKAVDALGNYDYDVTSVSLTATGATLSGSPVSATPSNGLATFSTLTFTNTGTGITLTAASNGLSGVTSSSFSVSAVTTPVTLASWNMYSQSSYGTSPLAATSSNANLTIGSLTKGSGVTALNTAASRAWGGTGWNSATSAAAITANAFITFTMAPNSGYTFSASACTLAYRRPATGAVSGLIQYQINSGAYVDIATLSFSSTSSSGATIVQDLSTVTGLQTVPSSSTVTFRLVPYGASANTGAFYIYNVGNSNTSSDLLITGTVSSVVTTPVLTISTNSLSGFTQVAGTPTASQTYTISGSSLTANGIFIPPVGFDISTNSGTNWISSGSTATLAQSGGSLTGQPITISVRMNSSVTGPISGTIYDTSTGAVKKNITVSGNVTPLLIAASTNNDIAHNFNITFTESSDWRSKITAVQVNGTALTASDFDASIAAVLTLKPLVGNVLLTTPGSKAITVIATGYANSVVTQQINNASGKITVTVIPQGLYNSGGFLNSRDTVTAILANTISPYAEIDTAYAIIDSLSFSGTFTFNTAANGSYYMVIRHRNSIETWSASGVPFVKGSTAAYDFTSAVTQAYGSNLVEVTPGKFAIFNGDVNQDGYVDPLDISSIDQDSFNYVSGTGLANDLNGDGFVDPLDLSIADQNSFNYVGVKKPTVGRAAKQNSRTKQVTTSKEVLKIQKNSK